MKNAFPYQMPLRLNVDQAEALNRLHRHTRMTKSAIVRFALERFAHQFMREHIADPATNAR
jgi:predicted DNA-binding protein